MLKEKIMVNDFKLLSRSMVLISILIGMLLVGATAATATPLNVVTFDYTTKDANDHVQGKVVFVQPTGPATNQPILASKINQDYTPEVVTTLGSNDLLRIGANGNAGGSDYGVSDFQVQVKNFSTDPQFNFAGYTPTGSGASYADSGTAEVETISSIFAIDFSFTPEFYGTITGRVVLDVLSTDGSTISTTFSHFYNPEVLFTRDSNDRLRIGANGDVGGTTFGEADFSIVIDDFLTDPQFKMGMYIEEGGGYGASYAGTGSLTVSSLVSSPIPEPTTMLLFGLGLLGLAGVNRRKQ